MPLHLHFTLDVQVGVQQTHKIFWKTEEQVNQVTLKHNVQYNLTVLRSQRSFTPNSTYFQMP